MVNKKHAGLQCQHCGKNYGVFTYVAGGVVNTYFGEIASSHDLELICAVCGRRHLGEKPEWLLKLLKFEKR